MFELIITHSFDAAHRIPDYAGPCSRMHGHTWKIRAHYRHGDVLNPLGMVFDLVVLKRQIREALVDYDHHNLLSILKRPTAENIAIDAFQRIQKCEFGKHLNAIEVEETPGCVVVYTPANAIAPGEIDYESL